MAGEGQEVAVQGFDVDRHMRHALSAIDEHQRAMAVRPLRHILDGVDAEHVGSVGQRHKLGLGADEVIEVVEADTALIVDVGEAQDGARVPGQELPGDHVAVVLRDAQNDLVAGLHELAAPGVRDEVDRLGRVAHEDDGLVTVLRVDKARDLGSHGLVQGRRLFRQRVNTAVDVGVVVLVVVDQGIDDLVRLLGGRCVIEIDQRLAVDLSLQDRKVLANGFDVVHVLLPVLTSASADAFEACGLELLLAASQQGL